MAYCRNCGAKLEDTERVCSKCGCPVNEQVNIKQENNETNPPPNAQNNQFNGQSGANQYNPNQQYGQNNPYGQYNPYMQNQYMNPNNQYYNPVPKERKLNVGLLVFSIINLFFNVIFGVLGLIFTLIAQNALTDEDEAKKLKLAKIFNIIGICLVAFAVVIWLVMFIILISLGD